jgi:hypothetical protein
MQRIAVAVFVCLLVWTQPCLGYDYQPQPCNGGLLDVVGEILTAPCKIVAECVGGSRANYCVPQSPCVPCAPGPCYVTCVPVCSAVPVPECVPGTPVVYRNGQWYGYAGGMQMVVVCPSTRRVTTSRVPKVPQAAESTPQTPAPPTAAEREQPNRETLATPSKDVTLPSVDKPVKKSAKPTEQPTPAPIAEQPAPKPKEGSLTEKEVTPVTPTGPAVSSQSPPGSPVSVPRVEGPTLAPDKPAKEQPRAGSVPGQPLQSEVVPGPEPRIKASEPVAEAPRVPKLQPQKPVSPPERTAVPAVAPPARPEVKELTPPQSQPPRPEPRPAAAPVPEKAQEKKTAPQEKAEKKKGPLPARQQAPCAPYYYPGTGCYPPPACR